MWDDSGNWSRMEPTLFHWRVAQESNLILPILLTLKLDFEFHTVSSSTPFDRTCPRPGVAFLRNCLTSSFNLSFPPFQLSSSSGTGERKIGLGLCRFGWDKWHVASSVNPEFLGSNMRSDGVQKWSRLILLCAFMEPDNQSKNLNNRTEHAWPAWVKLLTCRNQFAKRFYVSASDGANCLLSVIIGCYVWIRVWCIL